MSTLAGIYSDAQIEVVKRAFLARTHKTLSAEVCLLLNTTHSTEGCSRVSKTYLSHGPDEMLRHVVHFWERCVIPLTSPNLYGCRCTPVARSTQTRQYATRLLRTSSLSHKLLRTPDLLRTPAHPANFRNPRACVPSPDICAVPRPSFCKA